MSAYNFGPVTDAVLDCVAERHGVEPDEIVARLENPPLDDDYATTVRDWIERDGWNNVLGPAVDEFDDRLFPEERP